MSTITQSIHNLCQDPIHSYNLSDSHKANQDIVEKVCNLLGIRYDSYGEDKVTLTTRIEGSRCDIGNRLMLHVGIELIKVFKNYSLT